MTTLKNLKGTAIQFLDADPVVYVGAWSSGGNMNTGRRQLASAKNGTQSATLAFGGYVTSWVANNESYNGSSWTELNDLNTARYEGTGSGTQTAALAIGGYDGSKRGYTETWNGSSWTEVNDMNTARIDAGAGGTQTSSIVFGGAKDPGNTATNVTETWDGSSWSEVSDLNTSRTFLGGAAAVNTAALAYGGTSPGYHAVTEQWNGSSWTEVSDLNTAKGNGASYGTYTAAVLVGSTIPPGAGTTNVEEYNGTSWSEVNDVSNAVRQNAGAGGTTSGISFGGTPEVTATEEFSFPPPTATILQEGLMWFNSSSSALKGYGTAAGLPGATWASGSNINSARSEFGGGAGTQQAFLIFGGQPSPLVALTESYNGSSWTEVNDLNAGRYYATGFGTQTSAICASGNPGATVNVESWNGSNWTETGNVNTGRWGAGSSKSSPSTSGLIAGGSTGSDTGATETWNGSAWTEVADLNTARRQVGSCGDSQTAVLIISGNPAPKVVVEQWNGTSWTEVGDVGASRYGGGGSGTTTSALFIGGAPDSKANELWNGTSWTEVADTAKYHDVAASGGSGVSAIVAGGRGSGQDAHFTEEWTADAVVSTVTTS